MLKTAVVARLFFFFFFGQTATSKVTRDVYTDNCARLLPGLEAAGAFALPTTEAATTTTQPRGDGAASGNARRAT